MSGSISGHIINQRDGQFISGVNLKLTGDGNAQNGSSGRDGSFKFDNLAEGKYELTAKKTGFEDGLFGPLAVLDGNATTIEIALQQKLS